MVVDVRCVTDPACSWSWAAEPSVRRLEREFGAGLRFTYVMGGLARDLLARQTEAEARSGDTPAVYSWLVEHWLEVSEETGAPLDPLIWTKSPIRSSFPAAMAVKAAAAQTGDGGRAYLRAVREGLLCLRRKLDTTDALADEAARVGLDVARFLADLGSSATTEAFGADVEEARALVAEVPEGGRERGVVRGSGGRDRVSFPSLVFVGEDGARHGVFGPARYENYREAALQVGAIPLDESVPGVEDALRRFGRMTGPEVAAVCELPGPRAEAELWRLAVEWRVRPVRAMTGYLWEPVAGT